MSQNDPMDFGEGEIEGTTTYPLFIIIDGVAAQLLDEDAVRQLTQALREFTKAVLLRAHAIATESHTQKYPLGTIREAHIRQAVSETILLLATTITDASGSKKP